MMDDHGKQKVTLSLNGRTDRKLRQLAAERGEGLGDCVTAAINVLSYLSDARINGHRILLDHVGSGEQRELVLLDLPDPVPNQITPLEFDSSDRAAIDELRARVDSLMQKLDSPEGREASAKAFAQTGRRTSSGRKTVPA